MGASSLGDTQGTMSDEDEGDSEDEGDTSSDEQDVPTDDLPDGGPDIDLKLAKRIIRHTLGEPQDSSRKRAYKQGTAAIFRYLCDVLHLAHSQVPQRARSAKKDVFDILCQSVRHV